MVRFAVRRRISRSDWQLLALAVALVVPLYWPSLTFDLFEDDHYLLRPWPAEHLTSVLSGPWFDPQTADFYRPVAIYLYKAMFYVFGLNTRALHVLPLITMVSLAWLVGVFVRRETQTPWLGAVATALYALHPSTTAAIGPWLANQYQGLVSAMFLVSLLWWQSCRHRTWRAWVPLVIPAVIGGFTKETGLMIPVMLPLLHEVRARWLGDIPRMSRPVLWGALGTFVTLNLWRILALGSVLPAWRVQLDFWRLEFLRSPYTVLIEPLNFAPPAAKWIFAISGLLLTASAAWSVARRAPRHAASLGVSGAILLLTAAAPTAFIFSRDRLTPHGIAAVLVLTAGVAAVAQMVGRQRARLMPVLLVAAVATAATTSLARTALNRFTVCNSSTSDTPRALFNEVYRPPPEMLEWLRNLPRPCEARSLPPLFRTAAHITWGVAERTLAPDRSRYAWVSPRVVSLLTLRATSVTVEVRHRSASEAHPINVTIQANEGTIETVHLTSADWTSLTLPLPGTWHTWLRQMHRLDMATSPDAVPGVEMRPPIIHEG